MRHLGATADVRLLHLDERAGLGFLTDLVARTQVGPGADGGGAADVRVLHARAFHMRLRVHGGVDERRVRADLRFGADRRIPLQEAAGQDHRVRFDAHIVFDPRGLRVEDRHACPHPMLADAHVVRLGERGELHAVVHAFDAQRVRGRERTDLAERFRLLQRVGQVELALRVVRIEVRDRTGQHLRIEHIDRGVHFTHGQFALVGVLLLHDLEHIAVGAADDAAVPGRIVEFGRKHGGTVAAHHMVLEQCAERGGVEQRHVGRRDEHRPLQRTVVLQLTHRALHGAAGTGNLILLHDAHTRVVGARCLRHAFGLMAHDHGEGGRAKRGDRRHDTCEERLAGKGVQYLGRRRTHARTFARGQHDSGGDCHGILQT